jgi:hypothetical protein
VRVYDAPSCTGYFPSDNEPGGIENATHNTSRGKAGDLSPPCPGLRSNVLWVRLIITLEIPCIVNRFPVPPISPPIGDTSLTHVMGLAAHSITPPTPTTMGQ